MTATATRKKRQPLGVKRVVLNPRAYLMSFTICVVAHHAPLIIAFAAITKPEGYAECARLASLFDWLLASFIIHVVMAVVMVLDIALTLCQPVYRLKRPENAIILLIFLLYLGNLAYTIYGEASFRTDTSDCTNDSEKIQDRADSIAYFQHFDFVFTAVVTGLGCCTSYMCGVHTSLDVAEAERRWQKRCTTMFHIFTCSCRSNESKREAQHDEEDIFQSLGKILGKFFIVRYNTTRFEGLQFNDLAFMLGLVSKSQKQERREEQALLDEEAAHGVETGAQLPREREEKTLRDLAYFGKLAIGIYGWPIYVWYSPFYWFRVFGCFSKPTADQVFDHDNAVQGNRASFVGYTGIRRESLVYLNCYNFVFQAPYSIVKDAERRELIICVRGSMSFYDFVTDGLAKVEAMHPDELPTDIPNRHAARTHYGMLRTARSLFNDLQVGTRKQLFWDFAWRYCRLAHDASSVSSDIGTQGDWKIVVCGHSMGAGVGAILSVMLKKYFPSTRAFLYAPPMMFDPQTAAWSKSFMTTAVYGDDIVPRLSIANVTRLRDEMASHFHEVAYEPLYRVRYGGLRKKKLQPPDSQDSVELNVANADRASAAAADSDATTSHHQFDSSQTSSLAPSPARSMVSSTTNVAGDFPQSAPRSTRRLSIEAQASRRMQRASRLLDLDFLGDSAMNDDQEVDVPGEIIHIQTAKQARKCSCTVVLGEQQLKYTLRDASYFRRMWVNPRAVQDHMVHHYDRQIAHLVNECMDFGPADVTAGATGTTAAAANGAPPSARSSDLSSSSWIEESSVTDDSHFTSSTVTPYREVDEVV